MMRVLLAILGAGAFFLPISRVVEGTEFQDLGGTYDNQSAAAFNVEQLNYYLSDSSLSRYVVTFAGKAKGDGKVPTDVYFDGTINVSQSKPVIIDGGGCRFIFTTDPPVGLQATPSIRVENPGDSHQRLLQNFDLDAQNKSGILIAGPTRQTILRNIRITPGGSGTIDHDKWFDLDEAVYGVKIEGEGARGLTMQDVYVFASGGHGFIVRDKLENGWLRIRSHGAQGAGFKGQLLSNCHLNLVSESNAGWALHLRRCGGPTAIQHPDDEVSRHGAAQSRSNFVSVWFESNNFRSSNAQVVGSLGVRQFKIEQSMGIKLRGSAGWGSNKGDVDWGTRLSCDLQEDLWSLPAFDPIYDLNSEDNGAGDGYKFTLPNDSSSSSSNNWERKWVAPPRPAVRVLNDATNLPGVGTFWEIHIPQDAFDNSIGEEVAYWRPWGLRSNEFEAESGDCYIYEIVLRADSAAYNWCVERERMTPRRESSIIYTQIQPGGLGHQWVGIYDGTDVTIRGRGFLQERHPSVLPTPQLVVWDKGFANASEAEKKDRLQQPAMNLYVRSLRFWGIRAGGTPIKGAAGDG